MSSQDEEVKHNSTSAGQLHVGKKCTDVFLTPEQLKKHPPVGDSTVTEQVKQYTPVGDSTSLTSLGEYDSVSESDADEEKSETG